MAAKKTDPLFYTSPSNRKHTHFGVYYRSSARAHFKFLLFTLDRQQALKCARELLNTYKVMGKRYDLAVKGAAGVYGLPMVYRTEAKLREELL